MKGIGKYWKLLLALILVVAAVAVIFAVYTPGQREYEAEERRVNNTITVLRGTIAENRRYADVQELLPGAEEAMESSRLELYQHFPRELKEEDQILYVLYLEELFGTEITFSFGRTAGLVQLSDGSVLGGLTLTVNYDTSYQGFKEMIDYLSRDERITSIQYATMEYDAEADRMVGSLTLLCYVLDSELLEYQAPDVAAPNTGKQNPYD